MGDQFLKQRENADRTININPGQINVNVNYVLNIINVKIETQTHPTIPFREFIKIANASFHANQNANQILQDQTEIQFNENILQLQEERSLREIGIQDNDTIYVRLKLKGG